MQSQPKNDPINITEAESSTKWIFPTLPSDAVNQYVDFYHTFEVEDISSSPHLLISADTDYAVWLNGKMLGHGQYSDYPDQKTYDTFSLEGLIRKGSNTLCVSVFYNGKDSSVYLRGEPGLFFQIHTGAENENIVAASGTDTLCRPNPCYHSGPIATVSNQLFFTFGYDAQKGV
ncbi:MAG: hypothetical protein HRT90_05165, partial [Candidatus Margulisbacteria bacterium]|nr:hypothetical protein [Candidatus Margulisiibacteriota bacterium]